MAKKDSEEMYTVVQPEDFVKIAEALNDTQNALMTVIKRLVTLENKVNG